MTVEPEKWKQLRDVIAWLRANGPDDQNGEGVDEKTAGSAISMIDILERSQSIPPTIWWHGGDAIVLNFGGDGPDKHMVTISGKCFHVHYPRLALEAQNGK